MLALQFVGASSQTTVRTYVHVPYRSYALRGATDQYKLWAGHPALLFTPTVQGWEDEGGLNLLECMYFVRPVSATGKIGKNIHFRVAQMPTQGAQPTGIK